MYTYTGGAEGGLGRTAAAGVLSYVTTTTGTASGGLQHQSSLHFPSQSANVAPTTATRSATAKIPADHHQKSLEAKKRNVSFGEAYSDESRARFALLSKRKMSLPNAVRMNTPDSADLASSKLKSLKI